jgi:putative ABC transport system permease protein
VFRAALRSLMARKVRLLLTGLSVVLGVGFVAGTYVLTDTMTQAFDDLIETSTIGIDVIVQGEQEFESPNGPGSEERQPMPEELVDEISALDGVAVAAGDVLGFAQIVDPSTGDVIGGFGPPTFGASFSEFGGFTVKAGEKPAGPGQVSIDAGTAELYGIEVGDRVQILFEGTPQEFEVVGLAGFGVADNLGGATFALFDFETAQEVLSREGQVDAIYIQGDDDVTAVALRDRIAQVLPPNVEALTGAAAAQEAQDQVGEALGFVRTALLVFAFVSLFVGAFIIFNTFAIIVAQRTRELALLRALGASRRQVMTSVLVEAAIIGLVASVIGFGVGILIAIGLQGLLGAVGIDLPSTGTVIETRTFVVSIVVGTVITLVASLVPARRASRVAPIQALREAVDTGGRSLRFRLISGIAVLALGVAPLLYGLFGGPDNALQLVGFGVAFTFIGVAMLTPFVARPVAGLLGDPVRRTGISAKLGRENAMRNPRRTAATASALMIGLGLVVFVAVFGASAKSSVDSTLERTLRAEFIAISPSFTGFGPAAADAMREVPGVAALSELRQTGVQIDGKTAFLSAVDPATLDLVTNLGVQAGSTSSLSDPSTVLVFEDVAADNAWSVGDEIELTFASTGAQTFTVGGIYAEKGIVDDYTISLEAYENNVPQQLDIMVLVTAEDGADLGAVEDGLVAAVEEFPNVEVQDQSAFRDMYAGFVNQILNLITALLLMAVIIAIFGIVNTLSLSIYERTRELGLLRAVGMTRRQTRSMVRWEAVIISVMGAVFGVAIGIAFGWALQQALAPQGFTDLGIPGGQIAIYVVLAGLAGVVAAIGPARRAARLNVLEAISYE